MQVFPQAQGRFLAQGRHCHAQIRCIRLPHPGIERELQQRRGTCAVVPQVRERRQGD